MERNSAKVTSAEGWSSSRSRTLIRLEWISFLIASPDSDSNFFLVVSSRVTAMIIFRFYAKGSSVRLKTAYCGLGTDLGTLLVAG